MKESKCIAIIGFGWLGKILYRYLSRNSYYDIRVFSRNTKGSNICNNFNVEDGWITNVNQFDEIIYTVPLRKSKEYESGFIKIISSLSEKQHFYFISSSSVYSGIQGVCTEMTRLSAPASKSGKLYLYFEKIIKNSLKSYTILRSGGQYGFGRYPINRIKNTHHEFNKYGNYVHAYDLARIVDVLINTSNKPYIVNAVSDKYLTRKGFVDTFLFKSLSVKVIFSKRLCFLKHKVKSDWLLKNCFYFLK